MKRKLQFSEIATLIYFCIRSAIIGIGMNAYLYYGKVDAYLSIIIGAIIGIIPLLLILKVSNINKSKNIHGIIEEVLGTKVGKGISWILFGFVSFYCIVLFYDLINFIASEYLYKTPSYLIGIMLLIPIIYLLSKDLNVLGRTSVILFGLSIILYLFSLIGLIPRIDTENLLPFLENGISGPLKGAFMHIAFAILPLFIFTIIPKDSVVPSKNLDKKIVIAHFVYTVLIFIVLISIIGVLGIDLALLYQYPDYHLLRRIQVGGFIQRTESILAIQWVLCLFMMISICMYYLLTTADFLIPKNDKFKKIEVFLFPIVILILTRTLFQNNTIFVNFTMKQFPIIIYIFLFGIPLFIYIVYKLKNLKRKTS